ncbi:MAG: hypothetical protein H7287_11050, partial [Thermoleophilia bacterium]|nr:hypothetical protein [Thermoleophilia bacterium]
MYRTTPRVRTIPLALAACVAACLGTWSVALGAETSSPATPTAAATGTSATAATSAAQLDAYLAGKGSPMAGSGNALMASGGRWQIDPRLIIAIAGAE